jgi:hypothetical protein
MDFQFKGRQYFSRVDIGSAHRTGMMLQVGVELNSRSVDQKIINGIKSQIPNTTTSIALHTLVSR